MISSRAHCGFALITILIVTAVGLLFGAGALLLFRYQCQLRINRQHELEKIYAVRSALNYTRAALAINERGQTFTYHTGSERDLGLTVKPVDPIFPLDDDSHLDMKNRWKKNRFFGSATCDYEYGEYVADVTTSPLAKVQTYRVVESKNKPTGSQIDGKDPSGNYGLCFPDATATNNVRWWVNIGMPNTGGWLGSEYGRRYFFLPNDYVNGVAVKDIVRLCIIRTNGSGKTGWPLSGDEKGLSFQIQPFAGENNSDAVMKLFEYRAKGEHIEMTERFSVTNRHSQCYLGLQLAGKRLFMFYIENELNSGGCTVIPEEGVEISDDVYQHFFEVCKTDSDGYILEAPDLRAVIEVEAASDNRPILIDSNKPKEDQMGNFDFLTDFKVTPAYQYDVLVTLPDAGTYHATVAQKMGEFNKANGLYNPQKAYYLGYSMLTYDTHGTEHKGFRYDERHPDGK